MAGSAALGGSAFARLRGLRGLRRLRRLRDRRGDLGCLRDRCRRRQRGRWRRLALRRVGLRLQLRARLALELDRALQVLDRLLEVGDSRLRFLERLVARDGFLGRSPTLARTGLARNAKLIAPGRCRRGLLLDRRADASAGGAAARALGRGRGCGDTIAIRVPVGRLHADDLRRFAGLRARHFVGARNRDDRTAAQAVHVLAFERVGVGAEQRDQHLVERRARCAIVVRDLRKRVAALDRVRVARASRGCRRRSRGGSRARGRRANARRCDRFRRCRDHRRAGRIEQERVVADEPPRSPVDLDQQVEEGLADGRLCADPQIRLAIRIALERHARRGERPGIREIVLAIERRIGDARGERFEFFLRRRRELDPGRERLPERRADRQRAEAECGARARHGHRRGQEAEREDGLSAHTDPFRDFGFCNQT